MNTGRLLDTGVGPISENIALDQVIVDARGYNHAPNTVRFLQFPPPAVLVG